MTIWKYTLVLLSAILVLIAIILILRKCEPIQSEPTIVTIHDTTYVPYWVSLNIDSIKATVKFRPKVKYVSVPEYFLKDTAIHDTLWITTMPFEACYDTIIGKDTLSGEFYFPEFVFRNISVRYKDSIKVIHDVTTIQLPATFGQKMEYGLYTGIGGGIIGILGTLYFKNK